MEKKIRGKNAMKTVIVFNVTDEAETLLKVRKRYALIGFSRLEECA